MSQDRSHPRTNRFWSLGPSRTCSDLLQRNHHAPQGLDMEATGDFNPSAACQDDRQLRRFSPLRPQFHCHPLRRLIVTALFPTIPGQVPHQRFQRHAALFAELPLAEPALLTFGRQPIGFLTAPAPT
jgi:hypothetical protein